MAQLTPAQIKWYRKQTQDKNLGLTIRQWYQAELDRDAEERKAKNG